MLENGRDSPSGTPCKAVSLMVMTRCVALSFATWAQNTEGARAQPLGIVLPQERANGDNLRQTPFRFAVVIF
jgi:hypothetical protein